MAHFARVKNGFVHQVIVAEQDFIDSIQHTTDGNWIQTSYNTHDGVHYEPNTNPRVASSDQTQALRKNFASPGMRYTAADDAFYPPQPYSSWTLNTTSYNWEPPVAYPTDGNDYDWNEDDQTWDAAASPVE